MHEQQKVPEEPAAEQAPDRTHEISRPKRGEAPALRAAAYPRRYR